MTTKAGLVVSWLFYSNVLMLPRIRPFYRWAGGIMFSGFPSVYVCVCSCMLAEVDAFSDRLADNY